MSANGLLGIERFAVAQKITMMVNRYEIRSVDAEGKPTELLALAQQKRLAFKEEVTFYADEERRKEDVRVPVIEPLPRDVIEQEVRCQRTHDARRGAPAVRAPPQQAAKYADPHERRKRFRQQERVEHALDQEDRVEDPRHRDQEPAETPDAQVVPVRAVGHQTTPVEPLREEGAAADHER